MSHQPVVSVLMPTYNYAHTIGEAIESILRQSFSAFELIVVDDCSQDGTEEVVARYLNDSRVHFFRNTVNLGLVGNFNRCLQLANGEYIKFLLADDWFEPALLEKMVAVMQQYPGVSLVTSYSRTFGMRNKLRQQPYCHLQPGSKVIQASLTGGQGNWIGEPTTVMFRKRDLVVGGFDPGFYCLVDWDMWLRLLTMGDCYIIPEVLSYFRVHEQQASRKILQHNQFTFEDYFFHKQIEVKNVYHVPLPDPAIRKAVLKKAGYCTKAMYRSLLRLHQKAGRRTFRRGLRIAASEHTLFWPLISYFRKWVPRFKKRQATAALV